MPFRGTGATAIPDGGNSNFAVIDTFVADTFNMTSANSSFVLQTLNCLPALASISPIPGNTIVVNGVTHVTPISINPSATTPVNTWIPIGIASAYSASTYTPGKVVVDPYTSTKLRWVSVGYRLLYTGPVNTCSGSITITQNDVAFTNSGSVNSASLINTINNNGNVVSPIVAGTPLLTLEQYSSNTSVARTSTTYRPEQGVMIVPSHKTTDYKIATTTDTPYAVIANTSVVTAGPLYNHLRNTSTSNPYDGGIMWFDNDWSTYQIVGTGLNADASFRFETVLCFEVNPSIGSPFYNLTMSKSPPKNEDALKQGGNGSGSIDPAGGKGGKKG